MPRRVLGALSTLGLLALAGCADILSLPDDPYVISSSCEPQPPPAGQREARVRVQACDMISQDCRKMVADVTATLCNRIDCSTPILADMEAKNGEWDFNVSIAGLDGPSGFDGFLRITPRKKLCTDPDAFLPGACPPGFDCGGDSPPEACYLYPYVPAQLYFNPPVTRDVERPIRLPLVPTGTVPLLLRTFGLSDGYDPNQGIVLATAYDCGLNPLPDVSFGLVNQSNEKPLYGRNNTISTTATATDATGLGGFFGVSPGYHEIFAVPTTGPFAGRRVGMVAVSVQPFTVTYVGLPPALRGSEPEP